MEKNQNTETTIRISRDEYLHHTKEAEKWKNVLIALGENPDDAAQGIGAKIKIELDGAYDPKWTLFEKCLHYEDITGKIWTVSELKDFILKNEPELDKNKFQSGIHTRLKRLIVGKTLMSLKFNRSRIYSFYTTRREWIETDEKGLRKLLPEHMPTPELLGNLSGDQLSPENVEWQGL